MPNFCPNCGAAAGDGLRFCGNCGQPFETQPVATAASATPAAPESASDAVVWNGAPDPVLAPVAARTTKYTVTNARVVVDKGLIGKTNDSLELFRVKDIAVKKSLPQRARGVGDVVITSTDASTPVLTLEAVAQPDAVADEIRRLVQSARQRSNVYTREGL